MPDGVPLVPTANVAFVTRNCSCSGEERPVYARGSQSQSVFVGAESPPPSQTECPQHSRPSQTPAPFNAGLPCDYIGLGTGPRGQLARSVISAGLDYTVNPAAKHRLPPFIQ